MVQLSTGRLEALLQGRRPAPAWVASPCCRCCTWCRAAPQQVWTLASAAMQQGCVFYSVFVKPHLLASSVQHIIMISLDFYVDVRASARDVAMRKLEASGAVDGLGCTAGEAWLWVDMLPLSCFDLPEQLT